MTRSIKPTEYINEKTHITECNDGFWLFDKHRGMNLAMKAKSERAALIEALEYYQRRLLEVEAREKKLKTNVDAFLTSLGIDDHDLD